jgi:hypothetical protein
LAPASKPSLIIDVEVLRPDNPDVETRDPLRLSDLARCDWTDLLEEDLVADATLSQTSPPGSASDGSADRCSSGVP